LALQGGGWCNSIETCSFRQTTKLGSSRFMEHEVQFFGILSSDPSQNPDFFDWNKVKIRYCDGGSFSGHPDSEFKNGTEFFFRGQVIWEAVMDELLSIGLSNAKKALLSGCSAGGLATLIHCDDFREILPKDANVKCLVDAVCLDGSLPGYHLQKGFGSGSDKWVLHIEGGGWCNSIETCSFRQTTKLGSSRFMEHEVQFFGILSSDPSQNPDFFDWNKVKIRYCDGGSFSGHPDSEFKNGTEFFFRGQVIWEAVMDELLSIGLSNAKKALLSGCSAGGLATLIHCDDFREILPKDANVKCLVDAVCLDGSLPGYHLQKGFGSGSD
ncbi:hypothetical protein AABB24_017492, partial [Solanum stoloniferum]